MRIEYYVTRELSAWVEDPSGPLPFSARNSLSYYKGVFPHPLDQLTLLILKSLKFCAEKLMVFDAKFLRQVFVNEWPLFAMRSFCPPTKAL